MGGRTPGWYGLPIQAESANFRLGCVIISVMIPQLTASLAVAGGGETDIKHGGEEGGGARALDETRGMFLMTALPSKVDGEVRALFPPDPGGWGRDDDGSCASPLSICRDFYSIPIPKTVGG